jgi:ribosomal protein S18 acetylase RimI-like enzyme
MAAISAPRNATTADVAGMAESLALAFQDDPVMAWLFGDDQERALGALRKFFAHEGKRHLAHPTVFTTEAYDGAAYWDPPGHWKTPIVRLLGMAPFMVTAMRHRIVRAMRGLGMIEKTHAQHPEHYYLAVLGTRPDRQGNGVGSALMAPILQRCDEQGIGAYLESSKEANIPFYRRHGFEVVTELHLPKGPGLWPMWRDPQPPAQG